MFRPLMELLFSRLPPGLRRHAIQRVGRFLLETTLSSVMAEAAVLCNAVAWADPRLAGSWCWRPRCICCARRRRPPRRAARRRAAPLEGPGGGAPGWRINRASQPGHVRGLRGGVPLGGGAGAALRALAALPALPVAEALQGLLSSLLLGLVQAYPLGGLAPRPPPPPGCRQRRGAGGLPWSCAGGGGERPRWPRAGHPRAGAGRRRCWTRTWPRRWRWAPCWTRGDFAAACTAGAGARGGREALRALLWQLQGCLAGVSVCLAPLAAAQAAGAAGGPPPPAVSLVGELGAAVGRRASAERGRRAACAARRRRRDPDTLYLLLTVADSFRTAGTDGSVVPCKGGMGPMRRRVGDGVQAGRGVPGTIRAPPHPPQPPRSRERGYSDSLDHASSWAADEKWVSGERWRGGCTSARGCGTRAGARAARAGWWPTFLSLRWRASQAAYRGAATAAAPAPTLRPVPAPCLDYAALLVHHALHGYSSTRILATFYLERALKAWPCLVPGAAAPLLAPRRACHRRAPPRPPTGRQGWRRAARAASRRRRRAPAPRARAGARRG